VAVILSGTDCDGLSVDDKAESGRNANEHEPRRRLTRRMRERRASFL
jgi:hypothetical protein